MASTPMKTWNSCQVSITPSCHARDSSNVDVVDVLPASSSRPVQARTGVLIRQRGDWRSLPRRRNVDQTSDCGATVRASEADLTARYSGRIESFMQAGLGRSSAISRLSFCAETCAPACPSWSKPSTSTSLITTNNSSHSYEQERPRPTAQVIRANSRLSFKQKATLDARPRPRSATVRGVPRTAPEKGGGGPSE